MSTLWEYKTETHHYRVAAVGAALRLYTNGVFHSQWNKNKPFSGHLWDLLSLPVFFSSSAPKKSLLLGVGGGAAIKTLHHFFPNLHIDAVDLDPIHLQIAQNQFDCDKEHTHFFEENAVSFISSQRSKYDFIIDDLFVGNHTQHELAHRSVGADSAWLKQLMNRLKKRGTLVMNFESQSSLRHCVNESAGIVENFATIYLANTSRYENAIGIFSGEILTIEKLRENLERYISQAKVDQVLKPFEFVRLK